MRQTHVPVCQVEEISSFRLACAAQWQWTDVARNLVAHPTVFTKKVRCDFQARHPEKDPKSLLIVGAEYAGDTYLTDSEYRMLIQ